jgi:hypothetical protein
LALKTYAATKTFPKEELFGLGDQTICCSFRRFENSRNVEVPVRNPKRFERSASFDKSQDERKIEPVMVSLPNHSTV